MASNVIDYVTIASAGNATDFGDLTNTPYSFLGAGSGAKTFFAGGNGSITNVIQVVTTATTGDATDFGDLTAARRRISGSGNSTKIITFGGRESKSR